MLQEKKYLPIDYLSKLRLKHKSSRQHEEKEIKIFGEMGNHYYIILRKNSIDPLDFSIILRYQDDKGIRYNLVRYNGKHHHTNRLECNSFREFHIHKATQRYQENGFDIETFAESTKEYGSYNEAMKCFLSDLNFEVDTPPNTSNLSNYGDD